MFPSLRNKRRRTTQKKTTVCQFFISTTAALSVNVKANQWSSKRRDHLGSLVRPQNLPEAWGGAGEQQTGKMAGKIYAEKSRENVPRMLRAICVNATALRAGAPRPAFPCMSIGGVPGAILDETVPPAEPTLTTIKMTNATQCC